MLQISNVIYQNVAMRDVILCLVLLKPYIVKKNEENMETFD